MTNPITKARKAAMEKAWKITQSAWGLDLPKGGKSSAAFGAGFRAGEKFAKSINEEARIDKARLDWLDWCMNDVAWKDKSVSVSPRGYIDKISGKPDGKYFFANYREAIDAAMKEARKRK